MSGGPARAGGGVVSSLDSAPSIPQRGTRLGQYELHGMRGAGAMAQVFEAEHLGLHKRVAVKVLHPHLSERPDIVDRFVQEGIAAARIRHPNIVDVTDVGVEGSTPFLVMELLEGLPLSVLISRVGSFGPADAAWLLMPIVDAVAHAHKAGVIHRDLKPDNIFVVMGPNDVPAPKILDFGISKLVDDTAGPIHSDGMLGTPIYCAPEQATCADDIDERCDQYALGAILYNCLTGCPPFDPEESMLTVLRKVAEGRFDPPSAYRSDLPPAFEEIVLRAMALRREDRFPNLEMMRSALRRYGLGAKPSSWMQFLRTAEEDAPTDVSGDWDTNAATDARVDTPSYIRQNPAAVPLAPTVSLGSPGAASLPGPIGVIPGGRAEASAVDADPSASGSGPVAVVPEPGRYVRNGLLVLALVLAAVLGFVGIHFATTPSERPEPEPLDHVVAPSTPVRQDAVLAATEGSDEETDAIEASPTAGDAEDTEAVEPEGEVTEQPQRRTTRQRATRDRGPEATERRTVTPRRASDPDAPSMRSAPRYPEFRDPWEDG